MGNIFAAKKVSAPLLQPAIAGDINEIKALIGRHIASVNAKSKDELAAYVDQQDSEGNNALIGAVFSGHLDIAKFLIEDCHANIGVQNKIGCSVFWIACGYDHGHIVEYMIQRINAVVNNSSDSLDLVAVCSAKNSSGDTPFLAAASKGHCDILKLLSRSLKESLWLFLTETNAAGDTPLQVAVGMGHLEVLNLLLDFEEKYQDKDITESGSSSRPLNMNNAKGLTPLLVACERNFEKIVETLIARGADLTQTDHNGRSSLAIASFCGCMDVMDTLLKSEEAKTLLLNQKDSNGCTPLWLAARTGNLKMVKRLMQVGADRDIADNDGISPEVAAAKFKKNDVVDFFKEI
jgi:ankyrin repeat protein